MERENEEMNLADLVQSKLGDTAKTNTDNEDIKESIDESNNNNSSFEYDPNAKTKEQIEREELEKKVIGVENGPQLTVKDLEEDFATPATSMDHLKRLNERLDDELEEAKQIAKQREEEAENRKSMENIEKEKASQFNDTVVSDNNEEKKEEENDEFIPDLSSIKIRKTVDIDATFASEMKKRKAKAFTTKVVLVNSGYTASILGMSSPEIRNYSETMNNLDLFGQMEYKYKNMFSKIDSTSIGDMDYTTFLKRTALMEYEILNYGLFSSSFPESSTYPYVCPKCGAKINFAYHNKEYLDTAENDPEKREQILSSMRKVLSGQAIDAKALFEEANTNNLIRKYLKNSKIIVELRHPTLYDQLYDVLANINSEELQTMNQAVVNIMPFIKTVYLPTDDTINDPTPEYIKLEDFKKKVAVISSIDEKDDEALAIEMQNKILNKYNIKFTIRAPKCVCGYQTEPEEVEFDNMLFMTHQIRISQN